MKKTNHAYRIRQEILRPPEDKAYDFIFKVITYCNQVVENRIRNEMEKGNRILIK